MKHLTKLAIILVLASMAATAAAGDKGAALGAPGPWIFSFYGAPYVTPGFWAAEGAVDTSVEVGLQGASVDDSPDMVAEYYDTDDGVTGTAEVSAHQGWGSLYFLGAYQSADNQAAELSFDIKRMVRSHTSYDTFIHRLGHDPMTNLESTSTNGKVVWHTDLSPDQEYEYDYSLLDSRTELQLASLRALTLGVDFREQKREGHAQAYTTSHCDNCHIYSQSHRLDEKTSDVTLDAKLGWTGGYLKAAISSRELRYGTPSVSLQYDQALHPELQTPVFDNRLQFDSEVGPVAADLWSNSDKDKTRIELALTDVLGFAVNANGVWSKTENLYTNLQSDYTGYVLTAAKGWQNGWRLRWRGNAYTIDNDEIFIDVNDRPAVGGPLVGQTFEDVWGVDFDQTRYSALDRDVFSSSADLSKRLGRKLGTLRFIWDYQTIDRENYEVLPGEFQTTTNLLGASWRTRPAKGWNFEANLKVADVDNAFMLIDGTCSTLVSAAFPTPWNPDTAQYYEFQDARIAETTASASSWLKGELRAGYTSGATTVFGKYIYYDGDNSDGDLTDWSRQSNTALLTVWSAPTETFNWYATYTYMDSDLGVPACIPVFDG
ncbi:MAG: hypothetical protein MUE90_05500 [Thermoanaerobaculales bacterium]|jgi:hypothetical protein|nr:hypothetical protein [Thermoanaerobaculales bacterium]